MLMNDNFCVGSKVFSSKHPLIIAEAGTAHAGSIEKAFKLVDIASSAGCDAIKFQIVYADEILHPKSGYVMLPSGNIPLYEKFRELEVPPNFYRAIRDYAREAGLMFSASAFGNNSLEDLMSLAPDFLKLASPELSWHRLIKKMASYKKPLILSTGVSKLSDIEGAIEAARDEGGDVPLAILHCITSYPAPESEYNLSLIENLSRIFAIPAGLSDHSVHPFFIPLLSLTFSSCIIEKHICISKEEGGLDDKIALDPEELRLMCSVLRKMEGAEKKEIVDYLIKSGITEESILKSSGNGCKRLATSEKNNYERTNRSLHYLHDMNRGSYIKDEDIASLRTEKVLSVGLSPQFLDIVKGARLQRDVSAGDGVSFEDILARK